MTDLFNNPGSVRQFLIAAVGSTLAVRLYLLWQYYCISSDGVHYIDAAKDFYAGKIWEGLGSVYPPGYPVLLAAMYPLVGDWELTGQLISIFFGVLILWPLFLLFRDVFDARVALLALFLLAISPFVARYAVHVRTESTFLFFTTLTLLVIYQATAKQSLWYFLLGGMAAGFAYLVRPEAIGILAIVPGTLGLQWLSGQQTNFLWIGKASSLLVAGFALFALPYIVYLSIDTGQWGALSRKAGVTLSVSLTDYGVIEAGEGNSNANGEAPDFLTLIFRHPLQYLKKVGMDLIPAVWVVFQVLYYSYVPFFLLGLYATFQRSFLARKDLLLLGFVAFFIFGFTLILVRRRYSLQVVPISLGWTALGIFWAKDYLRLCLTHGKNNLVYAFLVVAFLGGTLSRTLAPISREKAFVRDSGLYLKSENVRTPLKIAVFDDRVPFYARAQAVMLTEVKESALMSHLKGQGANYLAVEARSWQKTYPNIALRPEDEGLVLEKEFVGTRKDRMLLFRVT